MNKRRFVSLACWTAVAAALPQRLLAGIKAGATAEDVGRYRAADRTQRLIDGARAEGSLTIYTSAPVDDIGPVVAAFENKYSVKIGVWRASSEKVLQRALAEARAGRHVLDVVETNGPELEAMQREGLLQKIESPVLAELTPASVQPHGQWVATRLNLIVQAYNTNTVSRDDRPQRWDDLLDPKWKGKLGIEAEDQDWFGSILGDLGEDKGASLFRRIVAANGVSVRRGHTLLTQMVASGEVPFALTVYNYKAAQLKSKGAPIEWYAIGNAHARPNGAGVARRAPNPHAAVLFYDFILGAEGQRLLAKRDFVTTNTKVDNPLARLPIRLIDPKVSLDEDAKWSRLYEEIFIAPGRRR